jgi:hypothetical protein
MLHDIVQAQSASILHLFVVCAITEHACSVCAVSCVSFCSTASSVTVRSTIRRLREQVEA